MALIEAQTSPALINRAPTTLRRITPIAILLSEILTLNTDKFDLMSSIRIARENKKFNLLNIPAKHLLELGLEVPKRVQDFTAEWFNDLPRELVEFISEQREGRKVSLENKAHSWKNIGLSAQAGNWVGTVLESAHYGHLWEFGIVVVGQDNEVNLISVSNPWYKIDVNKPWQLRLSDDELRNFVGREDILQDWSDALSEITGQPPPNPVQKAFDANPDEIWWGEAMNMNRILSWGEWDQFKKSHKATFASKIVNEIKRKISGQKFHELIKNAKTISGYRVEAYADKLPNSVALEFISDTKNWTDVQPEINIPEQYHPTLDDKTWGYIRGDNGEILRNGSNIFPRESKDFNFAIELSDTLTQDKNLGGSVGVKNVYITRKIRSPNSDRVREKHFVIGNGEFGDGWRWDNWPHSEKDTHRLTNSDWLLVAKLFTEAVQRAQTDSESYYDGTKGLTKRTRIILENTRSLIIAKMLKAGISKNEIDKFL